MKRIRKYQTALVAAAMAGFAFLPQADAADTKYERLTRSKSRQRALTNTL